MSYFLRIGLRDRNGEVRAFTYDHDFIASHPSIDFIIAYLPVPVLVPKTFLNSSVDLPLRVQNGWLSWTRLFVGGIQL